MIELGKGSMDLNESALWMVTQEPVLNDFVIYLTKKRHQILNNRDQEHVLRFSATHLEEVKASFGRMILRGERKLHKLCGLLSDTLFDGQVSLQSVVIGNIEGKNRFSLSQPVTQDDIYSRTDLDLGNWLLGKLRYQEDNRWVRPELVANFVEYQPLLLNPSDIHKMISRIKAEEEIWAKTVDEIFGLDQLVSRDKKLRELSFYIKDVFGIKLVLSDTTGVQQLMGRLEAMSWSGEMLARQRIPDLASNQKLSILEVKNHIGSEDQKKSGWQALKVVAQWWDKVFEIQLQPLEVYLREREYLTKESHANFKERRERIRQEVASQVPLFGFYLDLLKWFFIEPDQPKPSMAGIRIEIEQ